MTRAWTAATAGMHARGDDLAAGPRSALRKQRLDTTNGVKDGGCFESDHRFLLPRILFQRSGLRQVVGLIATVSVYDFSGAVSGRGGKTRPAGGARGGRAGEGEGASMGSIVAAGSAAGCEWGVRWAVRVDGEAASGEDEDMEPITALLYVAELGQLVVASGGGSVCVLDPQNGKQIASLSIPGEDEGDEVLGEPLALEFVENGCQLLVAFQSGAVLAWRWGAWHVVSHPAFDITILSLILINTVALAVEHHDMDEGWQTALQWVNLVLTVAFGLEMLLKVAGLGLEGYCADRFNVFDGLLVAINLVELSVQDGSGDATGFLHFCCSPCMCDAHDFLYVDSRTVRTADGRLHPLRRDGLAVPTGLLTRQQVAVACLACKP